MKRKICMLITAFMVFNHIQSYAGQDTTSDLLAIYDENTYIPTSDELRMFNSEMNEYNSLLAQEKQIQSYNSSVEDAKESLQQTISSAQQQVQSLLTQGLECSMYIEENIYGDYSALLQKDAEYKQLYRAADNLLKRVNSIQIPPALDSLQETIDEKSASIEESKDKMKPTVVHKLDNEFILGEVYSINNVVNHEYVLLSDYGSRISSKNIGTLEYHNGIDLKAPEGTDIYCMFNGTVIEVGEGRALGKFVRVEHGTGVISVYAHLSSTSVSNGQSVSQYDVIGKSGKSNDTTEDYLYLSLFINGRSVNPKVVLERGSINGK